MFSESYSLPEKLLIFFFDVPENEKRLLSGESSLAGWGKKTLVFPIIISRDLQVVLALFPCFAPLVFLLRTLQTVRG